MKRATASILFLIELLFGLNIAVPTMLAMGESNDNGAVTQDQNAANSAACKKRGTIQLGPSTSGEKVLGISGTSASQVT